MFGLSPWVRGTQSGVGLQFGAMRFIPVGTGNAPAPVIDFELPPVYPRGYGERPLTKQQIDTLPGLSPWVRGTPCHIVSHFVWVRFIPVGTGNALPPLLTKPLCPVYPRGYGERWRVYKAISNRCGLSPWVRGTHAA